ncbi:MAG: ABC transporter permease [Betaproteobacteria bacterium]|nr:ABC transporter permease [Betaproteobacteria bacterium]
MRPLARAISEFPVFASFWKHRELIWQMTRRDVVGRYRGSMMGLLWSFLNPVVMLVVYTFFFTVIFNFRWGSGADSKTDFALMLFAGMTIHALFAECLNRSPGLILGNVNYVKKVVFPLEILCWVAMGSALFHAAVSIAVLLGFFALVNHSLNWTLIFLPLLLLPYLLLIMGLSWWLAATGVYLRDVGQTTGIITTILMFLSPVFYPVSALPEGYRFLMHLNPLTFMIEQTRGILIWGQLPSWGGLAAYFAAGLAVAWGGLLWFQKARRGFADVL